MAPKRRSPLDEPPAASSSEEEGSGSSKSDSESLPPTKTTSIAAAAATPKQLQPQASSSGESESESESDGGDTPAKPKATNVKPIASKPMTPPPKPAAAAAKPKPKPSPKKSAAKPSAPKSGTKRPAASETEPVQDSKKPKPKPKTKVETDEKVTLASLGKSPEPPKPKRGGKTLASMKAEILASPEIKTKEVTPCATESAAEVGFVKACVELNLSESIVKHGLNLVGESERAKLKKNWGKIQIAELEQYVAKTKQMRDDLSLILKAMK